MQQQQQQQQLYSQQQQQQQQQQQHVGRQPLHLHPLTHAHLTASPLVSLTSPASVPNSPAAYGAAGPSSASSSSAAAAASGGLTALLTSAGVSVPTSVIQAPLTASPTSSSGGGSPSGGEDSYFSELALFNLAGYSNGSAGGLGSPQRRKKMRKSRSPAPDGCPGTGKRKNREGRRRFPRLIIFFCFLLLLFLFL